MKVEKETQYTYLIYCQIMEMFLEEESSHYIGMAELKDTENMTAFIHSLSCAACQVYQKLTGQKDIRPIPNPSVCRH
jgi:hypothetical protein